MNTKMHLSFEEVLAHVDVEREVLHEVLVKLDENDSLSYKDGVVSFLE